MVRVELVTRIRVGRAGRQQRMMMSGGVRVVVVVYGGGGWWRAAGGYTMSAVGDGCRVTIRIVV